MILSSELLLKLLYKEMARGQGPDPQVEEVSSQYSAYLALSLLLRREVGGSDFILNQFKELSKVLNELASIASVPKAELESLLNIVEGIGRRENRNARDLESDWMEALGKVEEFTKKLCESPALTQIDRKRAINLMTRWESNDLADQLGDLIKIEEDDTSLDQTRFSAYLQDRFPGRELEVASFHPLSGGLGKLTYLVDVKGDEVSGEMVLRRDPPHLLIDKDCHRIRNEHEVIEAVRSRGIPAPDILWLDTDHDLLPGGDFLVMRRSPGECGGNLFAARTEVSSEFTENLAKILGELHSLPSLERLFDLSESINGRLWSMPLSKCVGEYLDNWYALFERESHMPSPSLILLFDWIRSNVPDSDGSPALIHGDLGFHNFLIDKGELTTVLDWEFAHLGDPAEDLASLKNNVGSNINWDLFMDCYRASGGPDINFSRVRYYQAWLRLRDVMTSSIVTGLFLRGKLPDIKYAIIPNVYVPRLLKAVQEIVDSFS